jgi:caa(3)-type oxidase subunit IV
MTESHDTTNHGGIDVKTYFVIFGALAVFTAVSFIVNEGVRHQALSSFAGFVLILGVAVCKAVLVGMFFMHLKIDWTRLYFVIVPVMLLAVMMIVVLLPDIVLAWQREKSNRDTRWQFAPSQLYAQRD